MYGNWHNDNNLSMQINFKLKVNCFQMNSQANIGGHETMYDRNIYFLSVTSKLMYHNDH